MKEALTPKAAEILAHTRRILAFGGYNSFSYADLAERLNLSKAAIHHHFPSKEMLVTTLLILFRQEAREELAQLVRHVNDPLAELKVYTGHWAQCIRSGDSPFCPCAMLATEMPIIPEGLAAEVRGHFQDLGEWLASVLRRGMASGQFHVDGDPLVSARAFMAIVHGAMLVARATDDATAFEAVVTPAIARLTLPA
ncbi:TetR/AcrR family transcriptional regulator [Mitsuaria sp. 7]|uniref:TetR/AcrR family transcriptional regulator n=1 Tax=Mitsuaria sp. 7 TaxID=1658665 RepID=UPI0007DDDEE5|nr:TetR/AcrR family transcriptional regulator [Mitsuaria sp. 7]ANH68351.1 TetR family transcriptional regulator [Mitsuaria sp. 7]